MTDADLISELKHATSLAEEFFRIHGGPVTAEERRLVGIWKACLDRLKPKPISEIPDHVSHEEHNGGCASHHYVCFDGDNDGHSDWKTDDFVIKMKGTVDDPNSPPGTPGKAYLSLSGSGSYAMNSAVPSQPTRPDQILLLDYEKGIAKAVATGGSVDDFDEFLGPALRHLGKANVVNVDGHVYSMTREQLEWERDRSGGRWGP